ncbi:TetR/AcrR family transcriptional regulator [Paenarthrobacter nitroguajacolicus]
MTSSPSRAARRSSPRGAYAKTEGRRKQIIDAATAVFATHGYSGGSLRQISKDLSLSFTSLMHHFPSKELLLEAVLEQADQTATAEFEERRQVDGLAAAVLWLAEYNLGHPQLLRLLAVLSAEASSQGHPAHDWFKDRYTNLRQAFADHIRADQAKGRIDAATDPDLAAVSILAGWDGTQLQWLIDPSFDMLAALQYVIGGALKRRL